jgi:hypothetical protein
MGIDGHGKNKKRFKAVGFLERNLAHGFFHGEGIGDGDTPSFPLKGDDGRSRSFITRDFNGV